MALRQLLALLRRQLGAAGVGVVLTLVAAVLVTRSPGVYHARVDVVFLAPPPTPSSNPFQETTGSLISTAGLVAKIVSESATASRTVSDSVTLTGQGVTQGYSVRLPNSGGQWANNFDRAVLDVQVSGRSEAEVRRRLASAVERIKRVLRDQQASVGVRGILEIHAQLSPADPIVFYSRGSRARALAVTVLLGLGLTLALAIIMDGQRTMRRRGLAATSVGTARGPDPMPRSLS